MKSQRAESASTIDDAAEPSGPSFRSTQADQLGTPLSIADVARLIGCSIWTVRHSLLPAGLPHFQPNPPHGKYLFYEVQVRAWILARQREGGRKRRGPL